jgi:hypothetical protein
VAALEELYAEVENILSRYPEPFIGLGLPGTTLEKICSGNFRRLWGAKPRGGGCRGRGVGDREAGTRGVAKALKDIR